MVLVNDWTMTTRGSTRVSVTGLGDKRDTFSAIGYMLIFKLALFLYSGFVLYHQRRILRKVP